MPSPKVVDFYTVAKGSWQGLPQIRDTLSSWKYFLGTWSLTFRSTCAQRVTSATQINFGILARHVPLTRGQDFLCLHTIIVHNKQQWRSIRHFEYVRCIIPNTSVLIRSLPGPGDRYPGWSLSSLNSRHPPHTVTIQPFLTPVPPLGSEFIAKLTLPVGIILGAVRVVLILALTLVYITLVRGICLLFVNPSCYRWKSFL